MSVEFELGIQPICVSVVFHLQCSYSHWKPGKMGSFQFKNIFKNTGIVGEFCQSRKVGTMIYWIDLDIDRIILEIVRTWNTTDMQIGCIPNSNSTEKFNL